MVLPEFGTTALLYHVCWGLIVDVLIAILLTDLQHKLASQYVHCDLAVCEPTLRCAFALSADTLSWEVCRASADKQTGGELSSTIGQCPGLISTCSPA